MTGIRSKLPEVTPRRRRSSAFRSSRVCSASCSRTSASIRSAASASVNAPSGERPRPRRQPPLVRLDPGAAECADHWLPVPRPLCVPEGPVARWRMNGESWGSEWPRQPRYRPGRTESERATVRQRPFRATVPGNLPGRIATFTALSRLSIARIHGNRTRRRLPKPKVAGSRPVVRFEKGPVHPRLFGFRFGRTRASRGLGSRGSRDVSCRYAR